MKPKAKPDRQEPKSSPGETPSEATSYTRKHLRWGWWSLLVFLSAGVILETLHGFKVGAYLDVPNATRRLMWTLGHAHGTLLSLVHVAFAVTIPHLPPGTFKKLKTISSCLIGSSLMMPGGFFLGGAVTYGGDPGFGIFLLPIGAFMLFIGVYVTASCIPSKVL